MPVLLGLALVSPFLLLIKYSFDVVFLIIDIKYPETSKKKVKNKRVNVNQALKLNFTDNENK
jgi:hypothetical protein